ncbi:NAD(P)-dependent oxidoreductase [Parafrankia sp. EUN1f]|uniref:NAD(P)-dependent oxidoreductase n=1 Tax=Parafrankia sp. EUN1f TaxID=102897 RepID=UPI0001C46FF3|nr:NAD(P)-dependent oxidoreductase [Parafrankia sp. EUN1f]EFC82606.1 6-phosphogluconate dehydrogenase NAD-binding [Parafrankia sp. EUN1f]
MTDAGPGSDPAGGHPADGDPGSGGPGSGGPVVGFVGLGNMGGVLAANLVAAGLEVVAFDPAGPERVPAGAAGAGGVAEVAGRAEVMVLSLPNGAASQQVAEQIVGSADRRATQVVDTSTIGVAAARRVAALLVGAGIGYVDAPVSGGVAGARARTIAVMFAGSDDDCAAVGPVLAGLSDRCLRVGVRPGLAQALKLANNFLSATALVATSEAVAFGTAAGLDLATMLDVLNGASGQNTATSDKFPHHVLTGRYAAGFANTLMAKDVALYLEAVGELGRPPVVAPVTARVWNRFAAAEAGADFTRIYPFVRDG